MVTAIVLIKADVARIPETAETIAQMPAVSEVYSVTGEFDLVAMVRVRAHEELGDVIPGPLNKVAGVTHTETHIAFRDLLAARPRGRVRDRLLRSDARSSARRPGSAGVLAPARRWLAGDPAVQAEPPRRPESTRAAGPRVAVGQGRLRPSGPATPASAASAAAALSSAVSRTGPGCAAQVRRAPPRRCAPGRRRARSSGRDRAMPSSAGSNGSR